MVLQFLLGLAGSNFTAIAQTPGTFTPTGNLTIARASHSATLLADGRVLITGGRLGQDALASAEVYDPSTSTFAPTGSMITARALHSATLLPDGRVLIAGGQAGRVTVGSAELYDPATGTFSSTGDMMTARGWHTAILLSNGKVLIVGGYAAGGYPLVAGAELYDPGTGMFTAAGSYAGSGGCDFCPPAILLANGKVLFAGQYPAQLYDPVSNTFSLTGRSTYDHSMASLLMDGRVLFAGGEDIGRSSRAELYDPVTDAFSSTGDMTAPRVWHTTTLLPSGTVLTVGGETDSCTSNRFCIFAGSLATAELYDPQTRTFAATGSMSARRGVHTATILNDGRVLIAGGVAYGGIGMYFGEMAGAELYTPPVSMPAPALFTVAGFGQRQGAIWRAATRQVASPDTPAVAGEILEIYLTGLVDESVIPPEVFIGGRIAEILYFGKGPGGTDQVNVIVPKGIAAGNQVPVRLSYIGRTSNEVTIGVR